MRPRGGVYKTDFHPRQCVISRALAQGIYDPDLNKEMILDSYLVAATTEDPYNMIRFIVSDSSDYTSHILE